MAIKYLIKRIISAITRSPFGPLFAWLHDVMSLIDYWRAVCWQMIKGLRKPTSEEVSAIVSEATFIYKSFERQPMSKRLFWNIQKYYPGVKVIIADDSKKPLEIISPYAEVIQLPFNTGLSYGISQALEKVQTPYTIHVDNDMLLVPATKWHKQLQFLKEHPEIDLCAVQAISMPCFQKPEKSAAAYDRFSMDNAEKPLIIPHKTRIDDDHYVMGKVPNIFIARTEKYKEIGYDPLIWIIDHHEFFFRAAGNIVSAMDIHAFMFHYHNRFDQKYGKYRANFRRDAYYIREKHKNDNYYGKKG